MKPQQAFKLVNQYFWEGIKPLNWDANLFDQGIIRNDRTKKASETRKKAHEAIGILYQLTQNKEG